MSNPLIRRASAPSPAAAAAKPSPIESCIEQWFIDHWHGTELSHNTEYYNKSRAAMQDLKARLAKIAL